MSQPGYDVVDEEMEVLWWAITLAEREREDQEEDEDWDGDLPF